MCDKDICEDVVLCKKCTHGARLYHNPGGGCIKSGQGAPAVPFVGSPQSNEFFGWVVAVCKHQGCTKSNKPEFLSEDGFKSLRFRPHCPGCRQEMEPERDCQGKGNYAYRCPNDNCHSHRLLAEYLPVWHGDN